jgi:hypothetical protein
LPLVRVFLHRWFTHHHDIICGFVFPPIHHDYYTHTHTHTEGLFLNRNRLTGSIPTEVNELQQLSELLLEGNRLTGTLRCSQSWLVGGSSSTIAQVDCNEVSCDCCSSCWWLEDGASSSSSSSSSSNQGDEWWIVGGLPLDPEPTETPQLELVQDDDDDEQVDEDDEEEDD